jgi:hypothetical protein
MNSESPKMTEPSDIEKEKLLINGENDKFLSDLHQIHILFGITFCKNSINKFITNLKKSLLIIFDLLTIISFIALHYLLFNEEAYNRIFNTDSQNIRLNLIYKICKFGIIIEFIVVRLMTLINGSEIVITIKSFGK